MRVAGALWALDYPLAHSRHYPAISWSRSYSLYVEALGPWYRSNVSESWQSNREKLMEILAKEAELQEIVQLVGPDSLQESDRLTLEVSRMLRDGFLQQNATSEIDASCSLEKLDGMLSLLLLFSSLAEASLQGKVTLDRIMGVPGREELGRLREIPASDFAAQADAIAARMRTSFAALPGQGSQGEGSRT
jgi:V/A-type H+-transporting ATPase subunit A